MERSCFSERENERVCKYCSSSDSELSIKQWRESSLRVVANSMFPEKGLEAAILNCQRMSLYRRLKLVSEPYPHVALARIVITAFDGKLEAYNIPRVFCSSIDASSALERMADEDQRALTRVALGIFPYKGSPCKFAHSERGVGIYLRSEVQKIIAGRGDGSLCLIQVKTSLPPCDDCIDFWDGRAAQKMENGNSVFCPYSRDKIDTGEIREDWLEEIKKLTDVQFMAVEISCSASVEGDIVPRKTTFFRCI